MQQQPAKTMRRPLVFLVGAALAAALVVLVVVAVGTPPKKAEAVSEYRIVTKTFRNTNVITIPPNPDAPDDAFTLANPYPSKIIVAGLDRARIKDVNVRLKGFVHSWPDDMDVLLVGPTGKNAIIMSDAGDNNDVSRATNLTIDDEAPMFFPDEGQIVGTSYKPSNYEVGTDDNFPGVTFSGNRLLSTFDGTKPNGRWKLFVSDDVAPTDVGWFFDGWQLQIEAKDRTRR